MPIREVKSPWCSGSKKDGPPGVKHAGVYADYTGAKASKPSLSRASPGALVDGQITIPPEGKSK
jgi:hypothetical protein